MQIEGTIPPRAVETTVDTVDTLSATQRFMEEYPDARIDAIDGKIVRGMCCVCSRPVLQDDQEYAYNTDNGTYLCSVCNKE